MERLTIAEAADILGITRDAVRKRIKRDTIKWETGPDGETFVYIDASATREDTSKDASGQETLQALVESLQDQVGYLRREVEVWQEEARRKDHLLAAALERIPAIEPPPDTSSDAREAPKTASEETSRDETPEEQEEPKKRPWWRRLFK